MDGNGHGHGLNGTGTVLERYWKPLRTKDLLYAHMYLQFKAETNFSFVIFSKTFRVPPIKKNRGCVYIKIILISQMFILHYIEIFNKSSVA
jgi:hypothetical protein